MGKKIWRARDPFVAMLDDGTIIAVRPSDRYADNDPVVKKFRKSFITDDELAAVETATAEPGSRRTVK